MGQTEPKMRAAQASAAQTNQAAQADKTTQASQAALVEPKKNNAIVVVVLVSILSCAAPIATDLYLPALPDMPAYFATTEGIINLTLVGFFFFMAVGMIVFGPLSDKFGRKMPLLISTVLFVLSALAGAFATNVWVLVALRVVEGIGGGGMVAISTALVKDCFEDKARERALVVVQAMSVVGPMAAPVLGAIILSFTDWRGCFVAQAVLGLLALPFALGLVEPLRPENRSEEGVIASFGGIVRAARNVPLVILLLICAINSLPFMCYLSSISYVYLDIFGLTKFQYSAFFAVNASLSAVGAALVVLVNGRLSPRQSLLTAFVCTFVAGVLLVLVGHVSAFAFFLSFAVYSLAGGYARPISTVIMLDQQEGDTGALSSLINFTFTVLNSCGMLIAVLPWPDHVWGVAITVLVGSAISLFGLLALLRSRMCPRGL